MNVKLPIKLLCLAVLAVSGVAVMAQVTGRTTLTVGSANSSSAVFSDGFESGNFSAWTAVGGGTWMGNCAASSGAGTGCGTNIVTSPVHSGTYAAQQHYVISPSCGHCDTDYAINYPNPRGLTHFFVRGWVNFHNNGGNLTGGPLQRKLIYVKANDSSGNQTYNIILTSTADGLNGDCGDTTSIHLSVYMDAGGGASPRQSYCLGTMKWDTWNEVELEYDAGTPGVANGAWNVWLNGTKTSGQSGLIARDTAYSFAPNEVDFGQQADSFSIAVDEYRYWDDIAFSGSFIP